MEMRHGSTTLLVRVQGPRPAAHTLLFLHGLGDRGSSFEAVAGDPRLAGFRLLLPDLPGYGSAPRTAAPLPLARVADLLAAWLDERREGPVVLVGHSMGGTLAQLMAERHPSSATGLFNIEGNLCLDDCTVSGSVARQTEAEFLSAGFERLVAVMERAGRTERATRVYAEALRACDAASLHLHSRELVALSRPGDLARRLAALPMPVRYVAASPGGVGPSALALLKAADVPTTVLSPSGHSPQFDQPDLVVQALLAFLTSLPIR